MILYLRVALVCVWLAISCMIGFIMILFRWGDPNLDHDFAHLFAWGAQKALGVEVKVVSGAEHLLVHQPCIYVANHQSNLDLMIMSSFVPERALVIGKKELLWIPFFGLFFMAAGNIMIDRKKRVQSIQGLSEATDVMKSKRAGVWIFPEGTRNRTDQPMLPFKKGAFYMAMKAGVPIIPVVAAPTRDLVDWKRKRITRDAIEVKVLPPVLTAGLKESDIDGLIQNVRQQMLEAFHSLSPAARP